MTASGQRPRSVRLLATGILLTMGGIGGAALGLTGLFAALESSGYGSVEIRNALIFVGLSGAALGTGVTLVIWEISQRLEHR